MVDALNQRTSQLILEHQDQYAQVIMDRQYEIQPGLETRYDATQHEKALRDTKYNLSYLAEAIASSRIELFEEYIAWLASVLERYGVPLEDLVLNLRCILEFCKTVLEPDMCVLVSKYLQAGLDKLEQLPLSPPPSVLDVPKTPHKALATQYLEALLDGDRNRASQSIMEAVSQGTSVKDIYMHVFQPVQHEIGRLWQMNKISVAHEHYATAVTQLVMSQLYPHIFTMEKNGYVLVATCVGGELHEIGIRMVADFFEMEGWDTFYLGANTPADSVIQTLKERQAHVLAISATLATHVSKVRDLIQSLHTLDLGHIQVLVGGYPFNASPGLWRQIKADGYAPDADRAIAVATELVNGGSGDHER